MLWTSREGAEDLVSAQDIVERGESQGELQGVSQSMETGLTAVILRMGVPHGPAARNEALKYASSSVNTT